MAIQSLRLARGSSGALALEVYSVRTAMLRDVILEAHTWPCPLRKSAQGYKDFAVGADVDRWEAIVAEAGTE
jgi:hypothetical protein